MKKRRHVLVALWWWDERLLRGIATYAHEAGWILDTRMRHRFWHTRSEQVDGLITLATGGSKQFRFIRSFGVPVVDLGHYSERFGAGRVTTDPATIGQVAAEYFINCGLEHIGFVEFWNGKSTEWERRRNLEESVRRVGRQFHLLKSSALKSQLRYLPKPIGLMAMNDDTILDVMQICLEEGYQIPDQIALLGIDDIELLCELAPVPLSSINQNFERSGYKAAALLDGLMDGKPTPKRPVVVPIRGVTVRRSTDVLAVSDPHVATAMRFIREHFREPLKVRDVMTQVHLSRQAMQNRFRRHAGHSMHEEIMRLRIGEAKQLLQKTNMKIEAVAERSGFTDRLMLYRTFVKLVGKPPASWRQQQQI